MNIVYLISRFPGVVQASLLITFVPLKTMLYVLVVTSLTGFTRANRSLKAAVNAFDQ